jgi:hypothetical protein
MLSSSTFCNAKKPVRPVLMQRNWNPKVSSLSPHFIETAIQATRDTAPPAERVWPIGVMPPCPRRFVR